MNCLVALSEEQAVPSRSPMNKRYIYNPLTTGTIPVPEASASNTDENDEAKSVSITCAVAQEAEQAVVRDRLLTNVRAAGRSFRKPTPKDENFFSHAVQDQLERIQAPFRHLTHKELGALVVHQTEISSSSNIISCRHADHCYEH